MSRKADEVYVLLQELFPNYHIIKEFFIKYKGIKLFFDFYIKELEVLIEVQGQQHTMFVKHFHNDKQQFLEQKKRDHTKIEYVELSNKYCLIRFNYDEDVSKKLILYKVEQAMENKFYE